MSESRVQAVRSLPAPLDAHELRMFLGQALYFQDYIPNLQVLAAPLYDLLKKGVAFSWSDVEQTSFEKIKDALTSDTILAHPTEDGQLVLRTDASSVGSGGVLLLRRPGEADRPCRYFSHKFTETQRRWSTYDQELYSIMLCITSEPYASILKMRHFLIETDHRNLMYLSQAEPHCGNDKVERWKLLLLQYNFSIRHISGETNVVADCLSRLGFGLQQRNAQPTEHEVHSLYAAQSQNDVSAQFWIDLKTAQASDPTCQSLPLDQNGFRVTSSGRFHVPAGAQNIKTLLLRGSHGTPYSGHLGQRRCEDAILQAGFEWNGLHDDVSNFVKACPVCQKVRVHPSGHTDLHTTIVDQPFDTLAVDTIGPFPKDEKGNRYALVMIDVATRVVRLKATESTDAATAASAILSEIVARIATPRCIRSDNGPQFANDVIKSLENMLGIEHHFVIAHEPQGNGVVERVNSEISRHLRCLLFDVHHKQYWSTLLPYVEHILNNSVHSSLGVTPNALLYGNMLPNNSALPHTIVNYQVPEEAKKSAQALIEDLQAELLVLRQTAMKIQDAVVKKRLDKANTSPETTFNVGDFVLVRRLHDEGKSKLDPMYRGPYKIVEVEGAVLVHLQHLFDPEYRRVVHRRELLPFLMRDDVHAEDLLELLDSDDKEYYVEKVIGHHGKNKRDIRFIIRWQGYGPESDTEEPWAHVQGNKHVEQYIRAHPELAKLLE